jgi:hypothetical protein
MISQPPRGREEDLVIREFDEERKTIDLTIKAEGIIASAFYLFPLTPSLSPTRLCRNHDEGEIPVGQAVRFLIFRMRSF